MVLAVFTRKNRRKTMQQKDEPKVIVDQEALNAPNNGQEVAGGGSDWEEDDVTPTVPTVLPEPVEPENADSVEIMLDDDEVPLAPEAEVYLPGVSERKKPVGNERQVVGARSWDEIQRPPAANDGKSQIPSLPPDVETASAGGPGSFRWLLTLAAFVGAMIAVLSVQKCAIGDSADQLDRIEQVAVSARQAADGAVKATAELSGAVETLSGTVSKLDEEVKAANNLATRTSATLANFSHALLGNPDDPDTGQGLLNQLLDEAKRVRKALASQNQELLEFHMEFLSREAQLAELNSRLDLLSQQAEETFREVRVVREVVLTPRKVNVTVGVEPTSKVVVDQ